MEKKDLMPNGGIADIPATMVATHQENQISLILLKQLTSLRQDNFKVLPKVSQQRDSKVRLQVKLQLINPENILSRHNLMMVQTSGLTVKKL